MNGKKMMKRLAAVILAGVMAVSCTVPAFAAVKKVYSTETADQWMPQKYTGFTYKHDPMADPAASKDIIVDPNAIYGYSPNPESKRLGEYASYDWSDPSVVWKARQDRLKYIEQDTGLYYLLVARKAEGKSVEEIARELSALRNEIRIQSYDGNPAGLAKLKASNLETYGNENGPTPEYLYDKYGSWDTVLTKVFSVNRGMDACLGLYDDNYPRYELVGGQK